MNASLPHVPAFLAGLERRNPHQPLFHQAAREIVESSYHWIEVNHPEYLRASILERLTEPERVIQFRVTWEDDDQNLRVNRGYRVQFNSAIGPYKGGLRFHPSVTLDTLKFLGFEQIFKNALTGLPMGGGKGGSDFDPKGRSDAEVRRFCQAFMTELSRHIGPDTDVPAGDIGVGAREIGYLFGQYKRMTNRWDGAITGKGLAYGGSRIRPEATGYGAVYFTACMLEHAGAGLDGMRVAVSGSGNVAQFAVEKLYELGAKVVTMSDSGGFIHDPEGIDTDKLAFVQELKNERRGRIREYAEHFGVDFHANQRPWGVAVDWAFPCATQNELDERDARALVANGVRGVTEGANMPCTEGAVKALEQGGAQIAPAKAANAGGVGTSGFEMSQNAGYARWTRETVDSRLRGMMTSIHETCAHYGDRGDHIDYIGGANIGGMARVAEAMHAYGI